MVNGSPPSVQLYEASKPTSLEQREFISVDRSKAFSIGLLADFVFSLPTLLERHHAGAIASILEMMG